MASLYVVWTCAAESVWTYTMNMKAEYKEGPEARENFKRGMRALFQVPKKRVVKAERQPKKATARKTSGKDKG